MPLDPELESSLSTLRGRAIAIVALQALALLLQSTTGVMLGWVSGLAPMHLVSAAGSLASFAAGIALLLWVTLLARTARRWLDASVATWVETAAALALALPLLRSGLSWALFFAARPSGAHALALMSASNLLLSAASLATYGATLAHLHRAIDPSPLPPVVATSVNPDVHFRENPREAVSLGARSHAAPVAAWLGAWGLSLVAVALGSALTASAGLSRAVPAAVYGALHLVTVALFVWVILAMTARARERALRVAARAA